MSTYAVQSKEEQTNRKYNGSQDLMVLVQIVLRATAACTSLAASCLTFTCAETKVIYGVAMDAKYSDSSASKFFAYATAIACLFAFLTLSWALILRFKGSYKPNYHIFYFLHDLVIMSLLLSGCVAATVIGYIGKYGEEHAGWMPICKYFHGFCHKMVAAVVLGYVAFFCFFSVTIISASNSSNQITAAPIQNF